jgi:hypothetical protein
MKKHIKQIVKVEERPFCFRDFLHFEVDGKEYSMVHGTFRNKISKLFRDGNVELQYRSGPAFYSLKGFNFTKRKRMTQDRAVVIDTKQSVSIQFSRICQ